MLNEDPVVPSNATTEEQQVEPIMDRKIKEEPFDAVAALNERVQAVKDDPKISLRKYQDFLTEAKDLHLKIQGVAFGETYADAIGKHVDNLSRAVKVLDKCLNTDAKKRPSDDVLKKLVAIFPNFDATHRKLDAQSVRFGLNSGSKKRKKK